MEKLGLKEDGLNIFDDNDGTEVDEDECLLEYEKGSIFIISKEWKAESQVKMAEDHIDTGSANPDDKEKSETQSVVGELGEGSQEKKQEKVQVQGQEFHVKCLYF